MKHLKDLKLNVVSRVNLEKREMQSLFGGNEGRICGCGCHGPSSSSDNMNANAQHNYNSPGGNLHCVNWYDADNSGDFGMNEYDYSDTF